MTATILPEITATFPETLDISRITDGTVSGRGVLDQLLCTMTAHLNTQYEKNRITGTEYANLYLGAYQATLQQGIALALAKEQQAYEINNLIWEAKVKEAQYGLAVKQLEIASYELANKAPVEVANLTKQGILLTAEAAQKAKDLEISTYELATKLPVEVDNLSKEGVILTKQASNLDIDAALKNKELDTATYNLTTRIPAEVANLTKQGLSIEADTALKVVQADTARYVLASQLPVEVDNLTKQGLLLDAQKATADYELANKAPVEVANLIKQGTLLATQDALGQFDLLTKNPVEVANLTKQGDLLTIQYNTASYELNNKLPVEVNNLTKQGLLLDVQKATADYELLNKLPVEVANLVKQGLLQDKEYEIQGKNSLLKNEEITMAQKKILNTIEETLSVIAQKDLYLKKITTETGQTDGSAIGADSILDSQRNLMKAQTVGYDRDAEQKVAKIMLDTWVTRVNNDIGEQNNNNLLRDNNIGAAVAKMYQGIGVTPVVGP